MATSFVDSRETTNQQPFGIVKIVARDLLTVASFGILLVCIHELASPFVRGFQCNDETIRYPYKDSTVSSGACYAVGSGVNVLLILVLEYLTLRSLNNDESSSNRGREESSDGLLLKTYGRNVYCRFIVWLFGSIASELLTDISKVTAGRLRPHFVEVCRPIVFYQSRNLTLEEYCQQTSTTPYNYITDYQCSGDPKKLRDIRLSFLSGHSSYSAYSAAFAVIYIQAAMSSVKFGLIKPVLQVLIISAAFYTGLTRVSDYKHHWQDVLAGLLLGTTVASMVHLHLAPSFRKSYLRISKALEQRRQPTTSGEELNSFSY